MTYKPGDEGTTKGGNQYKILAVLDEPLDDGATIIGILTTRLGRRLVESWHSDGEYLGAGLEGENNLTPPKKVTYLNLYEGRRHHTRAEADKGAGTGRIACVKVEYMEGQFDE